MRGDRRLGSSVSGFRTKSSLALMTADLSRRYISFDLLVETVGAPVVKADNRTTETLNCVNKVLNKVSITLINNIRFSKEFGIDAYEFPQRDRSAHPTRPYHRRDSTRWVADRRRLPRRPRPRCGHRRGRRRLSKLITLSEVFTASKLQHTLKRYQHNSTRIQSILD